MDINILYKIGLFFNLKRSIALIGSCKALWSKRESFYRDKQHGKIIDLWTPEQNYYLSDKQLLLGVSEYTLYNEISYIFIYNNITYKLLSYNYKIIFAPHHRFMIIYHLDEWIIKYCNTIEEIKNIIEPLKIFDWLQFNIVDLQKSIPCWTKWYNKPKVDDYCNIISKKYNDIQLPI